MNKKLGTKIVSTALLGTMCLYTMPVFANTKEETVYSKLDNSGNSYSTIVSTKLKNDQNAELLNDISSLVNIKNTNGDETFSKNENKIVWQANGKSIQYQGETEKELPIKTSIKYELNGEEVEPSDIIGKEGKVKITISYENTQIHTVKINGKYVNMYTPFVVVAGTMINNENNSNIKIENGKLIENGTNTVAIGMCMPGMQQSLNISENDIKIPESFSIEMDTKAFEMNNIISYATAKVLDEADLSTFDKIDEIYSKVNDLQSASNQLVDGTAKLKDGANELRNGTTLAYTEFSKTRKTYESQLTAVKDETKLENAIRNVVNQELEKMLPELEKEAISEAEDSIEKHKTEIENSVVSTGINVTKNTIANEISKLDENTLKAFFKENEQTLKVLEDAITNDIQDVLKDQELVSLANMAKQEAIDEVKNAVSTKTKQELNNSVNEMKQGVEQGKVTFLTSNDKKMLNSKIDAAYPVTSQEKLESLKALAQTDSKYQETYQKALQSNQVNQILKTFVEQNGNSIASLGANNAINLVASNIDNMTSNVVDSTISQIQKEGVLDSYIQNYVQKLQEKIGAKLGTDNKEVIKKYEEELAAKLSNKLITNIKSDKTLNTILANYEQSITKELNAKIDSVAKETSTSIAKQYTKKLATEVATNLVEKQIADAKDGKVDSIISEEIAKYKDQIQNEISKLENGLDTLQNGLYQLNDGAEKLADGAETLSNGMTEFNDEGISKIANYINTDVKDLEERIKALKDLAKEYNTFAGKEDSDQGEVSFITIIDSIKESNTEKTENAANAINNTAINQTIENEKITNNTEKNETSDAK